MELLPCAAAAWVPWSAAIAGLGVGLVLGWQVRHLRRDRRRLRLALSEAKTALRRRGGAASSLSPRARFDDALEDAVRRTDEAGGPGFCLLYADLDGFQVQNETLGHDRGDELLAEVGQRFVSTMPGPVCRIVADEFVVIVPGDVFAGRRAAQTLASVLAGLAVPMGCSVGIAHYPTHGARPLLVANAKVAMRSVKQSGGNGFADYEPQMGADAREESSLLRDLRQALARGQFELFYQPKVDARTLKVTAAEALLRWRHPERGMVSPARFIPLAERHGLIGEIGAWTLEQACRQAAAWRRQGLRMRVAVNLSGLQLRQDDPVGLILATLGRHHIPPGRFTVEITESVAMADTHATRELFDRLREAGLHVSIDDFGTGYSSLASLRRLPAAELKIDRAFVCDLETSADARAIVEAIVHMAHTLAMRVVAEGVETKGQRDLLVAMGCDELQGFLFSPPMSAHAFGIAASLDDPDEHAPEFSPSLFEDTRPAET